MIKIIINSGMPIPNIGLPPSHQLLRVDHKTA
jgi:hypothetical protein